MWYRDEKKKELSNASIFLHNFVIIFAIADTKLLSLNISHLLIININIHQLLDINSIDEYKRYTNVFLKKLAHWFYYLTSTSFFKQFN